MRVWRGRCNHEVLAKNMITPARNMSHVSCRLALPASKNKNILSCPVHERYSLETAPFGALLRDLLPGGRAAPGWWASSWGRHLMSGHRTPRTTQPSLVLLNLRPLQVLLASKKIPTGDRF